MKIISWNMLGATDKWSSIIKTLFKSSDVVCLQECGQPGFLHQNFNNYHGFYNQTGTFNYGTSTRPLLCHYFFCKADNSKSSRCNLIIISKYTIDKTNIFLNPLDNTRRPAIGVSTNNLTLYTLHAFSGNGNDGPRFLDAIYNAHSNESTLVVGDFNRVPQHYNHWNLLHTGYATQQSGNELDYGFSRNLNVRSVRPLQPGNQSDHLAIEFII